MFKILVELVRNELKIELKQCTKHFVFCLFSGFDSVYALVNNAGVFYHPFYWTEDNFEATFQTNYLGKNTSFKYRYSLPLFTLLQI